MDVTNSDSELTNFEEYFYKEEEDPPPETIPVRIVNQSVLDFRRTVLNSLKRPYHPILYTSVVNGGTQGMEQKQESGDLYSIIQKEHRDVGI